MVKTELTGKTRLIGTNQLTSFTSGFNII